MALWWLPKRGGGGDWEFIPVKRNRCKRKGGGGFPTSGSFGRTTVEGPPRKTARKAKKRFERGGNDVGWGGQVPKGLTEVGLHPGGRAASPESWYIYPGAPSSIQTAFGAGAKATRDFQKGWLIDIRGMPRELPGPPQAITGLVRPIAWLELGDLREKSLGDRERVGTPPYLYLPGKGFAAYGFRARGFRSPGRRRQRAGPADCPRGRVGLARWHRCGRKRKPRN